MTLEPEVVVEIPNTSAAKLHRDTDGLHKRRGIWHYKLKVAGRWKEISTGKRNYHEARKLRQQAIQDQEAGRLPTDMAKWPFERAAKEYITGRRKLVAHQTLCKESYCLKPLLKVFGGRRLSDITGQDVRGYQIQRANEVSNATVNLEINVLRMILKRVKLWSRVADDYSPLRENTKGPGRALSPEEEKRLFTMASTSVVRQAE